MDYLTRKIYTTTKEVDILLDNICLLKRRPDDLELLNELVWKVEWLMSHFKEDNEIPIA